MSVLFSPYFVGHLLVFLMVKLALFLGIDLPSWISHHLNDLLCMPIVFMISLQLIRHIKKNQNILLPIGGMIFVCICWSVYFEYYLPKQSIRYTPDKIDVIMYALGTLSFVLWQQKQPKIVSHDA